MSEADSTRLHELGLQGAISQYGVSYTTHAYGQLVPWTLDPAEMIEDLDRVARRLHERLVSEFPKHLVWRQYPKFDLSVGPSGVELRLRCRYHAR